MSNKVYTINKGINKPIEFRGLKAQYIWHLGGVVLAMLILFVGMHIAGVDSYICLPMIFGLGGWLISRVYRMSKKYGQYGLMKKSARKAVPTALVSGTRKCFTKLFSSYASSTK